MGEKDLEIYKNVLKEISKNISNGNLRDIDELFEIAVSCIPKDNPDSFIAITDDSPQENTILHLCGKAGQQNIAQYICEYFDLNINKYKDKYGNIPTFSCIDGNSPETLAVFLKHGADINHKNMYGKKLIDKIKYRTKHMKNSNIKPFLDIIASKNLSSLSRALEETSQSFDYVGFDLEKGGCCQVS